MNRRSVDDAGWVLERYWEAKALLTELREDPSLAQNAYFLEELEDFHAGTFMDTCTTMDRNCGCAVRPVPPLALCECAPSHCGRQPAMTCRVKRAETAGLGR